jgi:chromosomal replication initiation ATPase DnaA
MWLRRLLVRDEQIRRRPLITLPGRHVNVVDLPSPPPIAPTPKQIPIVIIIATVAAHFGQPVDGLVEHRNGKRRRSTSANIALYLAKTLSRSNYTKLTRELHVATGAVRDASRRIARQREVDPELARTLAEIEAKLGVG